MAEGALFALQQPLAVLVALASGLLLRGSPLRQIPAWLAGFAASAVVSLLLPAGAWNKLAAAGALAVAGAWLASGFALHGKLARIGGACVGMAFGWASGLALATPGEAAGSVAAGVLMVLAAVALNHLLRLAVGSEARSALASRIAGSWLAAIGLLLVALAVARGR